MRALAHRLPVLESERFRPEFFTQCNDVALITLLGTVMKSANNLNQFVICSTPCITSRGWAGG